MTADKGGGVSVPWCLCCSLCPKYKMMIKRNMPVSCGDLILLSTVSYTVSKGSHSKDA